MIVVIEENASFYDARLGFIDGNHSLATGGNIVCSNLHGRTVKRETKEGIEMKIKIGFNPRCVVYANVIGVTFNATNGTNIYLKYAELFEKIADEKHSCDQSSFDCDNTECTIDSDSVESDNPKDWEEGCRPICGKCRVGYSCSTAGKCVITPNYNIRSNASSVMMIVVIFLIHFLI